MLSETSKKVLEVIELQLDAGDKKGLEEYGVSIDEAEDSQYNWNLEAMAEMADALKYQQREIRFLKQRNSDLRKKTYIKVHEENLKLTEEKKTLIKTIDQLRTELMRVGKVADKYYQDAVELGETNRKLRKVVQSVETFCSQFTVQ